MADGIPLSLNNRLIPIKDWPKYYPWPSTSALRHLIHGSPENGFGMAIRRVGRRILISEADFFIWVDSQNKNE